jgi:hypothetical protein
MRPASRRSRRSRRLGAALLASALLAGPGCFVLDELDKGNAMMDKRVAARRGERPPATATPAPSKPASRAGSVTADATARLESWWNEARSLAPGSRPEGVVRCRANGQEVYTREASCAARGGTVLPD